MHCFVCFAGHLEYVVPVHRLFCEYYTSSSSSQSQAVLLTLSDELLVYSGGILVQQS